METICKLIPVVVFCLNVLALDPCWSILGIRTCRATFIVGGHFFFISLNAIILFKKERKAFTVTVFQMTVFFNSCTITLFSLKKITMSGCLIVFASQMFLTFPCIFGMISFAVGAFILMKIHGGLYTS